MDPLFSKSHSELKTITKTNQPTKQQNPPKLIHCLPVFLSSRGYREFRVSDAILSRGALLSLPLSTQTSIESKTPLIQSSYCSHLGDRFQELQIEVTDPVPFPSNLSIYPEASVRKRNHSIHIQERCC